MIKRFTSLVACIVLVAVGSMVSAQKAETKVTKQIKAFSWLDVAVVDGNQVEGGLHVYEDITDLTSYLKPAQTSIGMMVSIVKGDPTMTAGTYRLSAWEVGNAAPLVGEWERVAETILVADIAARDAYVVADNSKALLAEGTMVVVTAGATGFVETYVYKGGTDNKTCWLSLSDASGAGFIAYGQGTVSYSAKGVDNSGPVDGLDITDLSKVITKMEEVIAPLEAGSGLFFISFPDAWNKPTFYVNDGNEEFPLNDCWTVKRVKKGNVWYQEWTSNLDFFPEEASGNTLSVIVR